MIDDQPLENRDRKMAKRELTSEERELTRWLLENADEPVSQFLEQLGRASVSAMCPCGCASFDLTIEGVPDQSGGMRVVSDFLFDDGDDLCGVFVFECNGVLSGVEVVGYSGDAPSSLPHPSVLRPFKES